tara:strand:+ start:72 stop:383 length:312 start_codon:yes stop_codon:yes gene_type:complete
MPKTLYGWYSPSYRRKSGRLLYHGENGEDIWVTAVSNSSEVSPTFYNDEVCVGIVTKYILSDIPSNKRTIFFEDLFDNWRNIPPIDPTKIDFSKYIGPNKWVW